LGNGQANGNLLTVLIDNVRICTKLSAGLFNLSDPAAMTAQVASEKIVAGNAGRLVGHESCDRFQRSIYQHYFSVSAENRDTDRDFIENLTQSYGKFRKPFDFWSALREQPDSSLPSHTEYFYQRERHPSILEKMLRSFHIAAH